jgi:hypothetical protein
MMGFGRLVHRRPSHVTRVPDPKSDHKQVIQIAIREYNNGQVSKNFRLIGSRRYRLCMSNVYGTGLMGGRILHKAFIIKLVLSTRGPEAEVWPHLQSLVFTITGGSDSQSRPADPSHPAKGLKDSKQPGKRRQPPNVMAEVGIHHAWGAGLRAGFPNC